MSITYTHLEGPIAKKLDTLFGVKDCLIEVHPGKVLIPPKYKDLGERIRNMTVRPDDTFLVSLPRTGSTWAQEMVWCVANDLDFKRATEELSSVRTPLLELTALLGNDKRPWTGLFKDSVETVENLPSPRFIKTHLPLDLLPKQIETVKPKMVYVGRNPKDVCVSYYHYCKLLHELDGTFDDFAELFLMDRVPMSPFWEHVLSFWQRRHEPNVIFLKYEDMRRDNKKAIRQVAEFLDKKLTNEQIASLEDYLSFNKMRENPSVNLEPIVKLMGNSDPQEKFLRKGVVGDYKTHMNEDTVAKFDKWTEENTKDTGLSFS